MLGQVDQQQKTELLTSAWVLVNTSIDEALAVSFLEALACETPLVSCQNPEGIVSRFGIYVGRWNGTGMEAVPLFVDALQRLLQEDSLRRRLGRQGREWVTNTHTRAGFLQALAKLFRRAGLDAVARHGSRRRENLAMASASPLISVVVTTHNREQLLMECIASVRDQSYPNWELLIVDDASSDGTWAWLQTVQDQRTRILRLSQHGQKAVARNAGLRTAGHYPADRPDSIPPRLRNATVQERETRRVEGGGQAR